MKKHWVSGRITVLSLLDNKDTNYHFNFPFGGAVAPYVGEMTHVYIFRTQFHEGRALGRAFASFRVHNPIGFRILLAGPRGWVWGLMRFGKRDGRNN